MRQAHLVIQYRVLQLIVILGAGAGDLGGCLTELRLCRDDGTGF